MLRIPQRLEGGAWLFPTEIRRIQGAEELVLSSSSLYEGLFMMGRTSIVGLMNAGYLRMTILKGSRMLRR